MTGPEHYAEAERALDYAEDGALEHSQEWYANAVAYAQVHATLAVAAATVDAQRGGSAIWAAWPAVTEVG